MAEPLRALTKRFLGLLAKTPATAGAVTTHCEDGDADRIGLCGEYFVLVEYTVQDAPVIALYEALEKGGKVLLDQWTAGTDDALDQAVQAICEACSPL